MRYGMCLRNDQLDLIKYVSDCGYDYVEGRFPLFARGSEDETENMLRLLRQNNIKCEVCNCFIPGDLRITGENVDETALSEYIERGMKNAKRAGCEIVVFGSGGARSIPDGFDFDRGYEQLVHFLKDIVAPICEKYGMMVVTEPLRSMECNIINTVREAARLAERVNSKYIASLADLYHMFAENEKPGELIGLSGKIRHSHIAEVKNRSYPKLSDSYDYSEFIRVMERTGCERCSVEGRSDDFEKDALEAMELFRSIK